MTPPRKPLRKNPSFVNFYQNDWRAGVATLTNREEFAYFLICSAIWDTGKAVPLSALKRLLRNDEAWMNEAIEGLLEAGKIRRVKGGALMNARAKESHEEAQERRKNAKKGGVARGKQMKNERAIAQREGSAGTLRAERTESKTKGTEGAIQAPSSTDARARSNGAADGLRAGGAPPAAQSSGKNPTPPWRFRKKRPPPLASAFLRNVRNRCGPERSASPNARPAAPSPEPHA